LTRTCLTASEGPVRHILCNIIEGTLKGAISDHKKFFFDNISKINGVIAIFVGQANFSDFFRFLLPNLTWPILVISQDIEL